MKMEIVCPGCKKTNLISNSFCYSCGVLLRPVMEGKVSYDSVANFLISLPDSNYYKKRMKIKYQNSLILTFIIGFILVIIFITGGFILILPEIIHILAG